MGFETVITLVATPPHPPLEGKRIQHVLTALQDAGAATAHPFWLAPDRAVDIAFSNLPLQKASELADEALLGSTIDAVTQPLALRRKKMLLADMDSTIIEQECLDELAAHAGIKDHIAEITERAMRGELDFKEALRARVGLLKGLETGALEKTLAGLTLMPGAETLLRTLRAYGVECHLVSGGFRFFTGAIARRLGFTSEQGNDLIVADGRLTGEVAEPVLDKDSKRDSLYRLAAHNGLSLEETMAVGDGANDIPMLQAAGLGIALHAKPKVNEQVRARIRHSDLTALLYVQGYGEGEIVF